METHPQKLSSPFKVVFSMVSLVLATRSVKPAMKVC